MTPLAIALANDPAVRRPAEQRYLDAINRARLTRIRRLVRRHRDLASVYGSGQATGSTVLDLAATVLVLRERGVRVPADETIERVLTAVLVVSRTYRYSRDPRSPGS